MSTSYRFTEPVSKLKFLKMARSLGLTVSKQEVENFCITDGNHYMWCYPDGETVCSFCRYGINYDAEKFLVDIAERLNLVLLSEEDEGYFEKDADEEEEET